MTCPVPLTARSGILDNHMENCFCDVTCGQGSSSNYIYVITRSGILCQINKTRLLERWVDANLSPAGCLTGDESHVFVGGAQGTIRMFKALNLQILITLPRPHSLGLDIARLDCLTA
ncbi:mitogen-activated protein kinase-binding protein 1 [Aplysia californica]|uniref:Mitogen-activated protein kinase-binding protein 1 n=1 Tax=Aplysia californica TaxID=6500 RepID=A0ABM0ZZ24_APLCA|nr:mitogen-activated protein kinase-binding protein 1 [Aplysia californica]